MRSFNPHSRQQDERLINRNQDSFVAGMFADIPASNIPDNGIAYLKDFVNFGDRLDGRRGSKLWGDYENEVECAQLPSIMTGITSTSTASEGTRTISTSGGDFDDDNVGDFFVHDDGIHEKILTVNGTTLTTITLTDNSKSSSAAWVRKNVNGIFFCDWLKRVVLFIGNDIYISTDVTMTEWELAYCESSMKPFNEVSEFDTINKNAILINRNGIYKIDLPENPSEEVYYYKINSEIPSTKLVTNNTSNNCEYRYVFGLGKIKGIGQNRNRLSTGCELVIDSGTNEKDHLYRDYSKHYKSSAMGFGSGNVISGLTQPYISYTNTKEFHWDVYPIWRTLDCGVSGIHPITGASNDSEAYAWVDDVPISKAFTVTLAGTICTVSKGDVSIHDKGSDLYIYNGASFDSYLITNVYSNYLEVSPSGTVASAAPAYIGAASGASISISNSVVTPYSGSSFTVSDINRRIFLTDGTSLHVSGVSGVSGLIVEDVTIPEVSGISCCWGEGSRRYYDNLSDDDLRSRIAGYPLYQRFYKNLPNGNTGTICPSFLFVATKEGHNIYFSQVPEGFEYLTGYYHEWHQTFFVKDGISSLKKIPDKLVVYCMNSTTIVPTNVTDSVEIPDIGVSITVLPTQIVVDNSIGVIADGSIQYLENGNHLVITSEPALREFDGESYGENLASRRLMEVLRRLKYYIVSVYSPYTGYLFWGSDE